MAAVRLVPPSSPTASNAKVPVAWDCATVRVSVEAALPSAGGDTEAGANEQDTPAGLPAQESPTLPV